MNTKDKDKLKHYYIFIATVILLFGAGWKVYGHFAKTSYVEAGFEKAAKSMAWVEERLAIGTHDDRVHRQEEAVDAAKNRIRFKENDKPPTTREIEDVEIQKTRLKEVEKEREELIQQYQREK